ncbi:Hypothetical protein LUCI_4620 [Lucifera butyrica]|uniref:Uncharacterized protein n=2 Tax=Lucifera butyrica TaxID=1351585 RepID=A0A498REU5_9FIRM|nr:Hypothetical protein LUCI_4620 [Lucifera butyrica]
MAEEVVQVNHRHLVLTIDEGLREIFERNRFLLKEFMDEAVRIVQEYFKKKYKVPLELLLVCIHLVRG